MLVMRTQQLQRQQVCRLTQNFRYILLYACTTVGSVVSAASYYQVMDWVMSLMLAVLQPSVRSAKQQLLQPVLSAPPLHPLQSVLEQHLVRNKSHQQQLLGLQRQMFNHLFQVWKYNIGSKKKKVEDTET